MEITISQTIDAALDPANTNTLKLASTIKGGNDQTLYKPGDAPPLAGAAFYIRSVEKKVFTLSKTNNFSEEILSLLQTPANKITGVMIYGYHTSDGKTQSPVRFDLSLKLTTMPSALKLSDMSNFQLLNLTSPNFTELVVNNVIVQDTTDNTAVIANLVVIVFTSNENQP